MRAVKLPFVFILPDRENKPRRALIASKRVALVYLDRDLQTRDIHMPVPAAYEVALQDGTPFLRRIY